MSHIESDSPINNGQTKEFFLIKKNSREGEYLMSEKNEVIMRSNNEHACWIKFIDVIISKNKPTDTFVLFSKMPNESISIRIGKSSR